jgi:N-acetylglutamate synthase-like GNAT family acetyltransferase
VRSMSAANAIDVREFRMNDSAAVENVLVDAYGRHMSTSLPTRLALAPHDWLVVEVGQRIAGVVSARRYGRVAYIGMMAVHRSMRRRGAGSALMQALIARLELAGSATMLLDATDEGAPLYAKFGFTDLDRTRVYEVPNPLPPEPDATPDIAPAELARAIALDAQFYGCDRSALLAHLATEHYGFVAAEHDGYALARGPVIGPFAAETDASARNLFARVRQRRPAISRAFAPESNPSAAELFESHGFECTRSLRHMGRGAPSPFRRARIFSQASLGHG